VVNSTFTVNAEELRPGFGYEGQVGVASSKMSKELGNLGREEANMSTGEANPRPRVGEELKAEFEFELVGVLERRLEGGCERSTSERVGKSFAGE